MKSQGMIGRFASVATLLAALSGATGAQQPQLSVAASDPEVSVNIRNENMPAKRIIDMTATPGSYVTVIRVSTNGVEVLYPTSPVADRALIQSTRRVAVPRSPTTANPLGAGSIFAFVSRDPYVFSKVADDNGWNSLHLANYAQATDEAIAETFGNEIAAPNSRVIMSKATTAPVAIISHDHSARLASLASFRAMPCPTLAAQVNGSTSSVSCVLQGVTFPNPLDAKPMQQQSPPQKTGKSK